MANTVNRLARKLEEVKKLASDVILSPSSYFENIKPLLFGTSEVEPTLDLKNPPRGGLFSVVQNGKLLPGQKIKVKVVSGSKEYTTADSNNLEQKDGNQFFYPSDLVRILSNLAKIFYNGDNKNDYNISGLKEFSSCFDDDLFFVKLWGQVDLADEFKNAGWIVEERFSRLGYVKVEQLFNEILKAAEEYEKANKKLDTQAFESQSNTETKLIVDIIPKILEKYEDYTNKLKPKIETDERFKEADRKLQDEVSKLIKQDQQSFFYQLYYASNSKVTFKSAGTNLDYFRQIEIYDPDSNTFLVTTRESDNHFGLLQLTTPQHPEYQEFTKQAIENFLRQHASNLTSKFILPLFEVASAASAPASTDEPPTQDGGGDQEEQVKFTSPVNQETLKQKVLEDIVIQLLTRFQDYLQSNESYSNFKDRLPSDYLQPVETEIRKQVEQQILPLLKISSEELTKQSQPNLFANDQFNPQILDSDWYKRLVEQGIELFINLPAPSSQYETYFEYLLETLVAPQLKQFLEETEEKPTEETESEPEEPGAPPGEPPAPSASGAVVPQGIPTAAPTKQVSVKNAQISTLSTEEIKELQYEAAWLLGNATFALYTSKGIEPTPEELRKLQTELFSYLRTMKQNKETEFNQLFANAIARENTLTEFYAKNGYGQQNNATTLLQSAIKEVAGIDSPIFTENVKSTIDSLVIQYGLNQDFYAFDPATNTVTQYSGTNEHDINWFIDNIPIERLGQIFNIPEGVLQKDPAIVEKLKTSLKGYAQSRAGELSLHIQNASLQDGLVKITKEDATKIKNGDEDTIIKHLSFTTDLRDLSKANGSETVAAAIDKKPNKDREKILKQYRSFIPLWENLTGDEQKIIYEKFGLGTLIPQEFDPQIQKLQFIQEFILFDISQLETIKQIASDATKAAELSTILAIQDQLIREEKLANYLNTAYTDASDSSEIEEINAHTGESYDDLSYAEKFQADSEIQGSGASEYEVNEGRRFGLAPRFLDSKTGKKLKSRFGRRFKKKLSPTEKTKRAANKLLSEGISKAAATALNAVPGVGTAASAALLALKNKTVRESIGAVILLGTAALVGWAVKALGTIGGLLGSVIGGAVGFLVGGPAGIIPGAIAGAGIGQYLIPQRWDGLIAGQNATSGAAGTAATGAAKATKVAQGLDLGKLTDSPSGIGVVAMGGYSMGAVFITLFIIFTIQSAFLIPVPEDRTGLGGSGGSGGAPILGSFGCFEFGPAGFQKQAGGQTITSLDWSESDMSLVESGFANVASNAKYIDLLCSAGPITMYRFPKSSQGYWGWTMNQNEMALYSGPFDNGRVESMEYVLIHETGHIITGRNPGIMSDFLRIKTDSSCYTYPAGCNDFEAFAEGMTLFVDDAYFPGNSKFQGSYGFQSKYPAEYNFFKSAVYGGQEF